MDEMFTSVIPVVGLRELPIISPETLRTPEPCRIIGAEGDAFVLRR